MKANFENFLVGLIEWSLKPIGIAILVTIGLVFAAMLVASGLIALTESVNADQLGLIEDEPMIVTEVQGRQDSIATGVLGDEAVNLYRTYDSYGSQTLGTVGNRVILIDHVPERQFRMRMRIESDLLSEEDIGDPLEDGGNP